MPQREGGEGSKGRLVAGCEEDGRGGGRGAPSHSSVLSSTDGEDAAGGRSKGREGGELRQLKASACRPRSKHTRALGGGDHKWVPP